MNATLKTVAKKSVRKLSREEMVAETVARLQHKAACMKARAWACAVKEANKVYKPYAADQGTLRRLVSEDLKARTFEPAPAVAAASLWFGDYVADGMKVLLQELKWKDNSGTFENLAVGGFALVSPEGDTWSLSASGRPELVKLANGQEPGPDCEWQTWDEYFLLADLTGAK